MRSATVTLEWDDPDLHPVDRLIAGEPAVRIETIQYISPLEDGTYIELTALSGDLDRARSVLDSCPEVLDSEVVGAERGMAYLHYRSSPVLRELLTILRQHEIVIEWPMTYRDAPGRGVRVTVLGTDAAMREASSEVPEEIQLTLERIGEYEPDVRRPAAALTDRQVEVLKAAVEVGYYEIPRRGTQDDVAERVGLSVGTVSEHLQRAEANLITSSSIVD